MDITIKASDGTEFYGTNYEELVNELNKYETELKQKKLEKQERLNKLENERKAKEAVKEYRYNQVLDKLESLNKVVEAYEKETGSKLKFVTVNGKLTTRKVNDLLDTMKATQYAPEFSKWWDDFFKIFDV